MLVDAAFQKRFSTQFSSTEHELCCRNLANQVTITGKFYRDSVNFYKKAQPNMGMRGFKLLHDNVPAHISCKNILQRRTLKRGHTLHTHLTLLPVTLSYSHLKKSFTRRSFKFWSALKSAVFSVWCIYPRWPIDQRFYNGLGDWRSLWK